MERGYFFFRLGSSLIAVWYSASDSAFRPSCFSTRLRRLMRGSQRWHFRLGFHGQILAEVPLGARKVYLAIQ